MRVAARKVIVAMREVRLDGREITTHNIAGQLGIKVQTVGANLQKMLREGLIRRHGMILQFDGKNRAKNMLWRINTLYVRKLEAEASAANDTNEEADGSTGTMHDVQGSQATKRVPQDQVQNAG
jgi:Mn-dependent DtxR family transcriptional regulator